MPVMEFLTKSIMPLIPFTCPTTPPIWSVREPAMVVIGFNIEPIVAICIFWTQNMKSFWILSDNGIYKGLHLYFAQSALISCIDFRYIKPIIYMINAKLMKKKLIQFCPVGITYIIDIFFIFLILLS